MSEEGTSGRAAPETGMVSLNQELTTELLNRSIRYLEPEVIVMSDLPAGKEVPLVQEGTVMCLIAREDSSLLADITDAARNRRFEDLKRYSDMVTLQLLRQFMSRRPVVRSLSEIPVLTEMRYAGRRLAQGMFLPEEVEVSPAPVVYSGGPLDPSEFRVVDYLKPGEDFGQRAVILVNEPRLSEIEKAILELVPQDLSEVFVASPSDPWARGGDTELPPGPSSELLFEFAAQQAMHSIDRAMRETREILDELAAGFRVDTDALRSALAESGPEEGEASSYMAELRRTNFEELDATASAQILLQLRRRLMSGRP